MQTVAFIFLICIAILPRVLCSNYRTKRCKSSMKTVRFRSDSVQSSQCCIQPFSFSGAVSPRGETACLETSMLALMPIHGDSEFPLRSLYMVLFCFSWSSDMDWILFSFEETKSTIEYLQLSAEKISNCVVDG